MRIIDPKEQHARRLNQTSAEPKSVKLRGESLYPIRQRPVCGAPMWYGETCGRKPGHAPGHRSRTIMDEDTRRRRTNWRQVAS